MDTESSNISTSFAGNPEDTHVSLLVIFDQFTLVNGSDSQFFLDSRDKWWSLETSTSEGLKSFLKFLHFIDLAMELDNGDVLFTGRLLSFDKSCGIVNASDQTSSNLWI